MKIFWENLKNNLNKISLYKNLKENTDDNTPVKGNMQFDRTESSNNTENKDKNVRTKLKIIYIVLFIWVFTIGFYFTLFSGISRLADKVGNKIQLTTENSYEVYKPGIDIIANLKSTRYLKYIQRLYVHPKEENKMMIMIKPNYWGVISQQDKNDIKSEVLRKWKEIYKNSGTDETLQPEAIFANS